MLPESYPRSLLAKPAPEELLYRGEITRVPGGIAVVAMERLTSSSWRHAALNRPACSTGPAPADRPRRRTPGRRQHGSPCPPQPGNALTGPPAAPNAQTHHHTLELPLQPRDPIQTGHAVLNRLQLRQPLLERPDPRPVPPQHVENRSGADHNHCRRSDQQNARLRHLAFLPRSQFRETPTTAGRRSELVVPKMATRDCGMAIHLRCGSCGSSCAPAAAGRT